MTLPTRYKDLSGVGVHNEKVMISGLAVLIHSYVVCYDMHVQRYILLANICNEFAHLKYDFLLNILAFGMSE